MLSSLVSGNTCVLSCRRRAAELKRARLRSLSKSSRAEGSVELLRKAGYHCTRGGRELVIRDAENRIVN